MSEALQALDSREIATACWTALAVVLCLFSLSLRHALAGVICAAAAPQIFGVFTVVLSAQLLATYGVIFRRRLHQFMRLAAPCAADF